MAAGVRWELRRLGREFRRVGRRSSRPAPGDRSPGAFLVEAIPLWRRGYGLGGNVIVRCREGHLFTTIWIPGASLKSLRFGPRRFQRCPVGHHWSLVTLVRESDLSGRARRTARAHKDIRIP